ncbi:MAG: FAD-binding oxidoreductase [Deltaproteobacteria bacterium]|nr:FAD-binding oxidoreductase [Deltaproteobacteria bacterium]
MTLDCDVVVVGAGIVGAACALRLAERGEAVVVVDRASPAGGATAAGMGHIVVMDGSEAQLDLTVSSRALWREHVGSMPDAVEYDPCGTLWIATDEEELATAEVKREVLRARGVEADLLTAAAVAEAEPGLCGGLAGGLRVPGDAVVYQPGATRWLLQRAVQAGAQLRPPVAVERVGDGRVALRDGTTLRARHVVVAAGGQTAALLETRALDDAIRPRKGHLAITSRAPGTCRHQLVELGYGRSAHGHAAESVAFNLQPRRTGQVLVGSSRQYGATDASVEPGVLGRMLRRAVALMPALAHLLIVRTWAGFRPATSDGLPLVGPLPHDPTVVLAAGHEGLGITTSMGTAALVEAIIHGAPSSVALAPFAPARAMAGGVGA